MVGFFKITRTKLILCGILLAILEIFAIKLAYRSAYDIIGLSPPWTQPTFLQAFLPLNGLVSIIIIIAYLLISVFEYFFKKNNVENILNKKSKSKKQVKTF